MLATILIRNNLVPLVCKYVNLRKLLRHFLNDCDLNDAPQNYAISKISQFLLQEPLIQQIVCYIKNYFYKLRCILHIQNVCHVSTCLWR